MRPRMSGSTDKNRVRSRTSASFGSGTSASTILKLSSVGIPGGRLASRICLFFMADNIHDFVLRYRPFGKPRLFASWFFASTSQDGQAGMPALPAINFQRRICDETTTHDLVLVFGSLRHDSGSAIG